MLRALTILVLLLSLAACSRSGDGGLQGSILFGDEPLSGVLVEVYLKGEKDRGTLPFASAATDERGRYRFDLPGGRYFIVAKKKQDLGGQTRMLMADCPANPLEVSGAMVQVPPFTLREMGRDGRLIAEPGTALRGRVTSAGRGAAGAYVYVYTEDEAGLMGPSYGEAVQTDEQGRFTVALPAGRFFLAARQRADGTRIGEPAAGDLRGSYPGNPVSLSPGETVELGAFPLEAVDAETHRQRMAAGKFAPTGTALEGRIVDPDGAPVSGVYVFAYLDARMVGKPTYISARTGDDGRFSLYLGTGGTFYLGARSTYGGPLEPGEWVGTFDGRPDHGIDVATGGRIALGDLTVREVW